MQQEGSSRRREPLETKLVKSCSSSHLCCTAVPPYVLKCAGHDSNITPLMTCARFPDGMAVLKGAICCLVGTQRTMGVVWKVLLALIVVFVAAFVTIPEVPNVVFTRLLQAGIAGYATANGIDRSARPSIEAEVLISIMKDQDMPGSSHSDVAPDWEVLRKGMDEKQQKNSPFPSIFGGCTKEAVVGLEQYDAVWIRCGSSTAQKEKVVLFVHGGGYVLGSVKSYEGTVGNLAITWQERFNQDELLKDTRVTFLLFNYSLAPEHDMDTILSDCVAVYRYLLDGRDPSDVLFMGDSAGGNMVLNLQLEAIRQGLPTPAGGVALTPWLDIAGGRDSYQRNNYEDPILSSDFTDHLRAAAAPTAEVQEKYSLTSRSVEELEKIAPTISQIGTIDILYDENIAFSEMVKEVPHLRVTSYEGMFHVFTNMPRVLPEAYDAVMEAFDFLREHHCL